MSQPPFASHFIDLPSTRGVRTSYTHKYMCLSCGFVFIQAEVQIHTVICTRHFAVLKASTQLAVLSIGIAFSSSYGRSHRA
jgi:hypothetical protein